MKTYKSLFLITLLIAVFAGCSDDNNMELNKGNTPLVLTVSTDNIALDSANPNAEALKFKWTSGSNQGTNAAIKYTFQMDVKGKNFAGGILVNLGKQIYEQAYTNEALNDTLINAFGIPINTEVTLEARVIATIASNQVQPDTTNIQTVTVKTHKPITKTLYLIGDATPGGWDANNAAKMTAITNTPKGFTWTGPLTTGNFKFITTLGSFVPSYNKGADSTQLYLRESFDDPYDEQFQITEGGTYIINVNLITLTISIIRGNLPEYTALWFVGDPDWIFKPMTVDLLDPFVFHYNADLSAGGEFKIGTIQGSFDAKTVFFRPAVDQTPAGTNLDVVKWAGDPDYKWKISGGFYKIKLNTRNMKIDIVPYTPFKMIWMIGDATSAGWTIDDAIPMNATSDPNVFTWTGTLNAGELKFTCDKQSDWNGAWFRASENDIAPTGQEEHAWFGYGPAGDYKWKVTAGNYSITLNQWKETIVIAKQ